MISSVSPTANGPSKRNQVLCIVPPRERAGDSVGVGRGRGPGQNAEALPSTAAAPPGTHSVEILCASVRRN